MDRTEDNLTAATTTEDSSAEDLPEVDLSDYNRVSLSEWADATEEEERAKILHQCVAAVDDKLGAKKGSDVLLLPLRLEHNMEEAATLVAVEGQAGDVGQVYIMGLFTDAEVVIGLGRVDTVVEEEGGEPEVATILSDLSDEDFDNVSANLVEIYEENYDKIVASPSEDAAPLSAS